MLFKAVFFFKLGVYPNSLRNLNKWQM